MSLMNVDLQIPLRQHLLQPRILGLELAEPTNVRDVQRPKRLRQA
jgi:hypothetical protein